MLLAGIRPSRCRSSRSSSHPQIAGPAPRADPHGVVAVEKLVAGMIQRLAGLVVRPPRLPPTHPRRRSSTCDLKPPVRFLAVVLLVALLSSAIGLRSVLDRGLTDRPDVPARPGTADLLRVHVLPVERAARFPVLQRVVLINPSSCERRAARHPRAEVSHLPLGVILGALAFFDAYFSCRGSPRFQKKAVS